MTDAELIAYIENEEAQSVGMYSGTLSEQRRKSIQYYNGKPYGNEVEGRSQVVTTETLDAIEGILPSLMNMFVSSDEAVRCDANNPQAEQYSQAATDYLNHVFYKDNNGFLVLYCLFKDALMLKNGFTKVYWETDEQVTKETYEGLTELEFIFLSQDDAIELVDQEEVEGLYNATFRRTKKFGKTRCDPVPPEEVRVSRDCPNDLRKARFVEHHCKKSISAIRQMGYEVPDDVSDDTSGDWNPERIERQDDQQAVTDDGEGASREVWIDEAYVLMDYDKDGHAERRKVTKIGKLLLDNEEVDTVPFISGTPILMPHKLFGLSVADLVMSIQEIKTALTRQLLDNGYLANNGRYEALDGMVNMDDLLTNRPGGVVRVKTIGAVKRIDTPMLGAPVFNMLEYFDGVTNKRVGVSPTQFAGDPNALNAKAHVAEIARDSAMQRIELIGRIMAETAVKPLFESILELECKHQNKPRNIKARNQWITVNPRMWADSLDLTITVGLGTGSQQAVTNGAMAILNVQQGMAASGLNGRVVTEQNAFAAGAELAKSVFPKTYQKFFTDPSQLPPPQPQVDPKIQLAAQKMQMQDKQKRDFKGVDVELHQQDLQHEAGMQASQLTGQAAIKGIDVASQTNLQAMQHMHEQLSQKIDKITEAHQADKQKAHEHVQGRLASEDQQKTDKAALEGEYQKKHEKLEQDKKDFMDSEALKKIAEQVDALAQESKEKDQRIKELEKELQHKASTKKTRTVKVKRDAQGNLTGAEIEE